MTVQDDGIPSSQTYDGERLWQKVEAEGGLAEAAFSYGLTADNIDDSTPGGAELKKAWALMALAHEAFYPLFDAVRLLLDTYEHGAHDDVPEGASLPD